jgi:hypothetical protein
MKKILLLTLIALVFLSSCKQTKNPGDQKISSSGKSAELLVVANEGIWKSGIGDTVFNFFTQDMPGLSTSEPVFDVVQIPHSALNKMFQSHRNILMLETEKQLDSAIVEIRENVWAQPQVVIRIRYPEQQAFIREFGKFNRIMLDYYIENELKRIVKAYNNVEDVKISKAVESKMGFALTFPTGFYIGKEDTDFMWLRQITNDYNMEVMLHVYRYEDTMAFTPDFVIQLRDKLGREFVPGPLDSTWMGTEKLLRPDVRRMTFNGMYAAETRGLWKVMNHASMGGPYLNYSILHEPSNRIIFLDGFVYHPNKEKRDLMRQLEGIFRSLKVK